MVTRTRRTRAVKLKTMTCRRWDNSINDVEENSNDSDSNKYDDDNDDNDNDKDAFQHFI